MRYEPMFEELESRCSPTTFAYESWVGNPDGSTVYTAWGQGWEDVRQIAIVQSDTFGPMVPFSNIYEGMETAGPLDTQQAETLTVSINGQVYTVAISLIDTHMPSDPTNPAGITHNKLIEDPVPQPLDNNVVHALAAARQTMQAMVRMPK